eukprot:scaffold25994_cov45-Cyclotella_meneghiniana.AAC.2
MPTVNQMNAARQQGDNTLAGSTQNLSMQQILHNFPPHAPRAQNSTATAAIRRLSVAFGGEHDQAASAAGPPPAVDSRLGQRPGNERRSQRESEVREPTINHCRAHTSLSVQ